MESFAGEIQQFCGSPFWNVSLTWNTSDPTFTTCFEKTALTLIPCLFLWTFAIFDIYFIINSKNKNIPWRFTNICKLIINSKLIVVALLDVIMASVYLEEQRQNIYPVDLYSPIVKLMTFILAVVLLMYNRKYGLRTSGVLFLFWLLEVVCGIPQFRTEIVQKSTKNLYYFQASYIIYYFDVVMLLMLNCFADESPQVHAYHNLENLWPAQKSSFLCKIFYQWFDSMISKGYHKPLESSDLWNLQYEHTTENTVDLFYKHWNRTVNGTSEGYTRLDSPKKKTVSIVPTIIRAFGLYIFVSSLLNTLCDVLIFASPQILKALISFVENDEPKWRGYFYVICLFGASVLQTLLLSQYSERMIVVGMRIRTALISAIYRKALKLSNAARKESTVGEIVNLMSVDAEKFVDLMKYINLLWSAPFQIALAMYFLWQILGPSVLSGLAVMLIIIPLNILVARRSEYLQIRIMEYKDERIKLMNEVLNSIKVIKLYAWETSFETQLIKIRENEIRVLKQGVYLNALTSFLWTCTPFVVSLVSFTTFVLVDKTHVLDTTTAFVSLALFNLLRFPLNLLPTMISDVVQTWVSIKRINKFMNNEEIDPNDIQHNISESISIVVENATFSWNSTTILKNINLQFRKGSLTAIVGTVGSGKSSLIQALLGEMERISGCVNTTGSIAYVPQQAWIQNTSLRNNILFGSLFDSEKYDKIIESCALRPDLDVLPAGDRTEIGEKGINLSGGQKQRVSLARAVYSDAEIYLFDDPLSAVDSQVGKHIFDNVMGPDGLLKNCTRVLVTHGLTYLPHVDNIVVLKDGEVSQAGTYSELVSLGGTIADILTQYSNDVVSDESCSKDNKDQLSIPDERSTVSRRLSRQTSRHSETETLVEKKLKKRSLSIESLFINNESERLIEEERAEIGTVKLEVYKYYLKSMGVVAFVVAIVFYIVFQGFNLGSNLWLSAWSEDKNMTDSKRNVYLGVYGAFGFGQACAIMIADTFPRLGCLYAAIAMHNGLLKGVLRAPLSFFDVTPLGRILTRFSSDIEIVDMVFPFHLGDLLYCIAEIAATIAVISYSTPLFIAVVIPITVIYYVLQRYYIPASRQLNRLESISRSPIYSHFGETLNGSAVIRAFNVNDRFIKESDKKVEYNQMCHLPSGIATRWLAVRLEMLGNIVLLFTALFAILNKDLNPGMVGVTVTYSLLVTQTLNWLVMMASEIETNVVSVERIKEYSACPQEASWFVSEKKPPENWPRHGTIVFQDLALRYRSGLDLVLKDVNIFIKGGEKVGIVGRTGAGKSTFTLALFRIIEAAKGRILIDGIDIAELGLHDLRSCLTVIPQDAVLFSGSLRMNLDPFNKHSDEEIWNSLKHAHLDEYVLGLPAGLEYEINEGGENLSAGQRQLICLSRALLRKTKVLILDEATASVDLETDDLIQKTIRRAFCECTVITVAHRLNTIMDYDRIMVLNEGSIIEFDSPNVLLQNRNSAFYLMAKHAGLI